MRTTVVTVAVSTALWLAAPAAQGQSGRHPDGLWIGAGLGHGTMNRSCDSCWSAPHRRLGPTRLIRMFASEQPFTCGGSRAAMITPAAPPPARGEGLLR